jgi:hypothetical protein
MYGVAKIRNDILRDALRYTACARDAQVVYMQSLL